MAFNFTELEIDRTVIFDGTEYRVIDESESGLLLVAKEDDVKSNKYPLQLLAIPNN